MLTNIPADIQEVSFKKFNKLPIKNKLIIYAKLKHGNNFKVYDYELFDQTRRSIGKIFKNYIESIKDYEGIE